VDPETEACIKLVRELAEKWQPPPGPIVLSEDYLRLVERLEQHPRNAAGRDKSWVERMDQEDREHFRSIVRHDDTKPRPTPR
jgi:hypothetical protein